MGYVYSMILISNHIFDSIQEESFAGYICIKDQWIEKVEKGMPSEEEMKQAEKVIRLDDQFVMPGITDCHTFFTGYAIYHVGIDVSAVTDSLQVVPMIKQYIKNHGEKGAVLGHGWNPNVWNQKEAQKILEKYFPKQPVILFAADRGSCIMNRIAEETYQFDSDTCWPEMYYLLMREYLNDRSFIDQELYHYINMMNSRGVTTVKEMGFDDFYGFTDVLKELEPKDEFHLRFFFMSQPVGQPMNLAYAKEMKEKFQGDKIRFSGFNRMTDGTIASYNGDLKQNYENKDFTCGMEIDWDQIEKDVLSADQEGFRWSLHCQGNGAVAKAADIFEKCQMKDGKLIHRQALTDMEYSDEEDLKRLGEIGACAELYYQIMSLDPGQVVLENIKNTIGEERGKNYWNRRKMSDQKMILCGATDLPLMITSLQESIYYSCGGKLDGGIEFQPENTISVPTMLKAWTIGGQTNLEMDQKLGTLEAGKLADIAVFSRDFTQISTDEALSVENTMTIFNGNIVFERGE